MSGPNQKNGSARELRILHVVRNLNFGGLEVGVVNLVQGLHRMGVRQSVCCLEEKGVLAERLPEGVFALSCADLGRRLWDRTQLQAARLMRSFRPHVIHARNCGAWVDAGLAWLLAGRPGRLAFSVHGWDRLGQLPWKRALIYRQLARLTDALAAVSPETAEEFARETGISAKRFTVLYSGVDTDRFHPREPRPGPAGPVVLGCVGRLDSVKGHDLLIRAFAQVVHDLRADAELRLIGDGPLRSSLEELARQCRVEHRVRFIGSRDDIPQQLRELDVFVLSSLREGRPTSIMEAAASGLPVVASDVGSIRALVRDGVTGLVIEPGNVSNLARGIGLLVADTSLRRRFGDAARGRAVAEFSLDRMVRDYLAFYSPPRATSVSGAEAIVTRSMALLGRGEGPCEGDWPHGPEEVNRCLPPISPSTAVQGVQGEGLVS